MRDSQRSRQHEPQAACQFPLAHESHGGDTEGPGWGGTHTHSGLCLSWAAPSLGKRDLVRGRNPPKRCSRERDTIFTGSDMNKSALCSGGTAVSSYAVHPTDVLERDPAAEGQLALFACRTCRRGTDGRRVHILLPGNPLVCAGTVWGGAGQGWCLPCSARWPRHPVACVSPGGCSQRGGQLQIAMGSSLRGPSCQSVCPSTPRVCVSHTSFRVCTQSGWGISCSRWGPRLQWFSRTRARPTGPGLARLSLGRPSWGAGPWGASACPKGLVSGHLLLVVKGTRGFCSPSVTRAPMNGFLRR